MSLPLFFFFSSSFYAFVFQPHTPQHALQTQGHKHYTSMVKETVVLDLGRYVRVGILTEGRCPLAVCTFLRASSPSLTPHHTPPPTTHSALIKCGFAGESAPRHLLLSPLDGWSTQATAQGWGREEWVQALGPLIVRLLVHHLHVRPRDRKVLVCELLAGPTAAREALAFVLLDWLKVPALLVVPSLTLPLYTAGAEGGLVVDVGFRECHVLAVVFGRPLLHTYTVAGVGAMTVLERAQELLRKNERKDEREEEEAEDDLTLATLQDVVLRACFVPSRSNTDDDTTKPIAYKEESISLILSPELRITSTEVLFDDNADDGASLPVALLECLQKCPRDVRRLVAGHVLVTGGVAMLPGFCRRLAHEVKHHAKVKMRYQELCPLLLGQDGNSPSSSSSSTTTSSASALCIIRDSALLAPRNVLTWVGGSILGVLAETASPDSSPFVTRESYLAAAGKEGGKEGEEGRRRCFTPVLSEWLSVAGGGDET